MTLPASSAQDGLHLFGAEGDLGGELRRQGSPAGEQGDAFGQGQQGGRLVQGIFAAAQDGHVLAAVEKGVAGGAVAHAVALQGLQAGDGGARHGKRRWPG